MTIFIQPTSLPPLIPSIYEAGTWFIALLCCTYALPSTVPGPFTDTRNLRLAGGHSQLPLRKKLSPGQTISQHYTEIPNGIQGEGVWVVDEGKSQNDKMSHDRRRLVKRGGHRILATLKMINSWAVGNRKINNSNSSSSAQSSQDENLRHSSNFSHLGNLYAKNSSSFPSMLPELNKRIVRPYDKKVFVYGKDDRVRILPPLLRKFPYSNIVRLSTGCTGTLVTPLHVLTAAHCVHNGRDFRNNLEMLKVEVPDTMGVRAYYIEKIGIPVRWLHPRRHYEHQSSWDYAVVRLSYPVHGRSQFFPLAVPTADVLNENLQFLGFPNNQDDLWMSVCPARSNKAMVDGNLILTRCDSAVGNSGAAVLSDDSREGKKIIGILSSTMPVGRMPYYTRFSIITALTWSKLYDICAEIGSIGVSYHVCPPLKTIQRLRRFNIHNNVIPFFG